jgi:hypothetical protein
MNLGKAKALSEKTYALNMFHRFRLLRKLVQNYIKNRQICRINS